MSAPTSWAWTIYGTDGVTVLATYTTQNPSHTFAAAGSYFARLVATNVHGSSDTGLVAVAVAEPGAWSHVRTTTTTVPAGSTSGPIVVPSIQVGNLVVVSYIGVDPTDITAQSDALSNAYVAAGAIQALPGGGWGKNKTFWGVATTGSTAPVALTGAFTGATASGYGAIVVTQYLHTGTVALVGAAQGSGSAVGGPMLAGPLTPTVGNVLLYGTEIPSSVEPALPTVPTGEPPWTPRYSGAYVADRLNLPAGTYPYAPTYAGVQSWRAELLAFTTTAPPADAPPTGAITSHANPSSLEAVSIILAGTAADDIGVASVSWRNATTTVTGAATGTTAWTTTAIPLQVGLNNLEALITDSTGQVTVKTIAITRTVPPTVTPVYPRFMRGFGAVRGVTASDVIQTPLTTHAVARTRMLVLRREELALPRVVWTKSTQAIPALAERLTATTIAGNTVLLYERQWSGGTASWHVPAPAPGSGFSGQFHLAIADDTSAPANVPLIWIQGVPQTVTVVRQPGGGETVVNNAAGYMLGNWPGGSGDWGGDLAKFTLYNAVATTAQVKLHAEGADPVAGVTGLTAVAYHVLDGVAANEPNAVGGAVSVVTGTAIKDYAVATAAVSLAVTAGNPAGGVAYQVTATVTGSPAHRVEFDVGGVLTRTDTVAPYTLFAAPALLGAGPHTIDARVYVGPGGSPTGTATLVVTEPSVTSGTFSPEIEFDRKPDALSYKVDVNGTLNVTTLQPASGNPHAVLTFPGPDVLVEIGVTPTYAAGDGPRMVTTARFTDPALTPVEGFREIARPYIVATTTWTPTYRWERKPAPVLSYNVLRAGSVVGNVLQPASGRPTYTDTFTNPNGDVVIGVEAVYAGGPGPRMAVRVTYIAPTANATAGLQILSRTFTP